MFERFTDRARRVVVLAQEEARMLNHNYIGTEHLLLGLLHQGEGVAAQALESMGISLDAARRRVEGIIGQGQAPHTGHVPFTPRAKKVLELSLREARQLGHDYIGSEHILLGVVREGEGVAAQVLQQLGATLDHVRERVMEILGVSVGLEQAEARAPLCPRCARDLTETGRALAAELQVRGAQEPGEGAVEAERVPVTFLFCGGCGVSIGAWPGERSGS